jgi:invasion protein IalB
LIKRIFATSTAVTTLILALGAELVLAQTAPPPAAATSPAATMPSGPDQTTANYGDWVLRCVRTGEGVMATRACEVVQSLSLQGQQQPLARVAIGSPEKPEALRLTLMIAPAVSLGEVPRLYFAAKGSAPILILAWRRCLPTGCFADGALTLATLSQLKQQVEPMNMTLQDAAEKQVNLSISTKGLALALDALAKEPARESPPPK